MFLLHLPYNLYLRVRRKLIQNHDDTTIAHYENTPLQYTAIFHGCEDDNFQVKNSDIFLIFAQNIALWKSLRMKIPSKTCTYIVKMRSEGVKVKNQ